MSFGAPDRTMPGQGQFVKQYECKHCPYITRECVSIRRHVMTHLRYHPYHCPLCDVTSIRSKAIKTHLANVHKNHQVSPLLIKAEEKEREVVEGYRKVFGDTPKRLLKEAAGYLPPLSQTLNAYSPFAKGMNRPKLTDQSGERLESDEAMDADNMVEINENPSANDVTSPLTCRVCKFVSLGGWEDMCKHVTVHFKYK